MVLFYCNEEVGQAHHRDAPFFSLHANAYTHTLTNLSGGKYAYRDQGYRLLTIWLHGLDSSQNPMTELNLALRANKRTDLAVKIAREIETSADARKKGCVLQ